MCTVTVTTPTDFSRTLSHTSCPLFSQKRRKLDETNTISQASFDKLLLVFTSWNSLPALDSAFIATRRSSSPSPCALCGKHFRQGATPGSPYSICECDLRKDGRCLTFRPYASTKVVVSIGNLSDLLICPKEYMYTAKDGIAVEAHRLARVVWSMPSVLARARSRLWVSPA